MEKELHVVSVHSMSDVITNSSTELFIVDENKVTESMKELFKFICECNEIDYESEIFKYDEYEYKEDFVLPEEYVGKTGSLYIINASNHNDLLNQLIDKYFNVIELTYKNND
jgi:hypothetical protein